MVSPLAIANYLRRWIWNRVVLGAWLGITGAAVFKDGEALRIGSPTDFTSEKHKTYALWWSGRGVWSVFGHDLSKAKSNLEEVILPDPRNKKTIRALDESFTDLELGSRRAIKSGTKNAKALGATVYWYNGWTGVAMTLQDPEDDNGRLVLEVNPKHMPAHKRPVFVLKKKKNREAFNAYWELYKRIRGASEKRWPEEQDQ